MVDEDTRNVTSAVHAALESFGFTCRHDEQCLGAPQGSGVWCGPSVYEFRGKDGVEICIRVVVVRLKSTWMVYGQPEDESIGSMHKMMLKTHDGSDFPERVRRSVGYHLLKEELDPMQRQQPNLQTSSVYLRIFEYLDPVSICRTFKVCKETYQWKNDPIIWQSLSKRDWNEPCQNLGQFITRFRQQQQEERVRRSFFATLS